MCYGTQGTWRNHDKLFKNFCEKRQYVEGYLFYDAVLKFRKEGDPVKRTQLFRKIKERFIMKNAIWHINIFGKTLNSILMMNEENISNEVLNKAFNDNKHLLETDQFSKFKCTKPAKDLINEIYRKKNVLFGLGQKNGHGHNRHKNANGNDGNNNNNAYNQA